MNVVTVLLIITAGFIGLYLWCSTGTSFDIGGCPAGYHKILLGKDTQERQVFACQLN